MKYLKKQFNMQEVEQMTEKKAKALELMLKGTPISQIAEAIGLHRNTLYQWLKEDEFKEAKEKAENQLIDGIWLMAMYEIEDVLLNTKDEYKKIQIFQQLAKIKGKEETTVNINQIKSVDEMIANLKR